MESIKVRDWYTLRYQWGSKSDPAVMNKVIVTVQEYEVFGDICMKVVVVKSSDFYPHKTFTLLVQVEDTPIEIYEIIKVHLKTVLCDSLGVYPGDFTYKDRSR